MAYRISGTSPWKEKATRRLGSRPKRGFPVRMLSIPMVSPPFYRAPCLTCTPYLRYFNSGPIGRSKFPLSAESYNVSDVLQNSCFIAR